MKIKHLGISFILLLLLFGPLHADGLRMFPPEIQLHGQRAAQRVIVLREEDKQLVEDVSMDVSYQSADPKVVSVDAGGFTRAVGDGETTITATMGSETATIPAKVTGTGSPLDWNFRNHVVPILTKSGCNSGACHGALAGKGGLKLSLRGYDAETDHYVMTREALGRRMDAAQPERSLILQKPSGELKHGGGLRLEGGEGDYQIIRDWITAGAGGPSEGDAKLERLEVFPPLSVLQPDAELQIVVRATYSDGRQEDVTRWAKFGSTEDLVASVEEDGSVTVSGHGEATINVFFSNLVGGTRIASPMPDPVDSTVYDNSPEHNYIDDLVIKKLRSLNIPPSGQSSDEVFIRRAFLDAAGILPTPAEVEKFVTDSSPGKRGKLIDALLERHEFVDYWTYKWCDLFLVSSRKLPTPAMWAFYQYIHQSVESNKPWDRMAHELLTASGSTIINGAANYYALHKDVAQVTESTSVTFMGTSITCARCHNHPLEKWTQDQYWSMANLFSRVSVKDGQRTDELVIQSQPTGDVLHQRRGVPMAPAPLDGSPLEFASPLDRRQYFAKWLTAKDNPYFSKALVNRVWANFMGRGLVEAEDDLRETNPPSNVELYEALARDFVEHNYDVKHVIRAVMNSAAYQRAAEPIPGNVEDDRYYSRYLIRRLPAEVLLDAYSHVTGVPTPFEGYSEGIRALELPDVEVASKFLDTFGRPDRLQTCSCEREEDSSVSQALHLSNGQTLNDKLQAENSIIDRWTKNKNDDRAIVEELFMRAFSRKPGPEELERFLEALEAAGIDPAVRRTALEDIVWAALTTREFVFNR